MGTLRAREIFHDAGCQIIAVESVEVQKSKADSGCHAYGKIEPVAVIVCGPDRTYALDMESAPAPLDRLRQDVPGLDAMMAAFG